MLNLEVVAGSSPTVGAPANVDQALSGKTQVDSKTAGAPARSAPIKAARPAQTVESGVLSGEQIFPIANLNPYQSKWTVKARVTQKSYREYTNARGSGTLINVDLLDLEGGTSTLHLSLSCTHTHTLSRPYVLSRSRLSSSPSSSLPSLPPSLPLISLPLPYSLSPLSSFLWGSHSFSLVLPFSPQLCTCLVPRFLSRVDSQSSLTHTHVFSRSGKHS